MPRARIYLECSCVPQEVTDYFQKNPQSTQTLFMGHVYRSDENGIYIWRNIVVESLPNGLKYTHIVIDPR
jgi:hypothetical protein